MKNLSKKILALLTLCALFATVLPGNTFIDGNYGISTLNDDLEFDEDISLNT